VRRLAYASFGLCVSLAVLEGCVTPLPQAAQVQATGWQWLPARVRRLSNAEYEQTVSEILGAPQHVAERLPPEARQEGYSRNADSSLPAAFATRLDTLAREMARETVKNRLATVAPCSAGDDASCADEFVEALGRRAYRRPLAPDERRSLQQAFTDGARDGGFAAGAEVVLRIVLQSPNLLYLTELGPRDATAPVVTLTPYEIASALSYTVRGGPPDEELLAAAATGTLSSPVVREAQARRLIGQSETRHHFRRFILEWLEVDGLERTAKSNTLFPDYERLRSHMLKETADFADEVMVHGGASIRTLHGSILWNEDLRSRGFAHRYRPCRDLATREFPRRPCTRGRHQPGQARRLRDAQASLRESETPRGSGDRNRHSARLQRRDHARALRRAHRRGRLQ
jgi:hypothetical protein